MEENRIIIKWGLKEPLFNLLPSSLKKEKAFVTIYSCLTNQGINEQQSVAIYRNSTQLQEEINAEQIITIQKYFVSFSSFATKYPNIDMSNTAEILSKIKTIIESSRCEKNVEILPLIADFVRRIGGLRCTLCKSGKDRTSMAVTWEQGRWLSRVYVFLFLLFLFYLFIL